MGGQTMTLAEWRRLLSRIWNGAPRLDPPAEPPVRQSIPGFISADAMAWAAQRPAGQERAQAFKQLFPPPPKPPGVPDSAVMAMDNAMTETYAYADAGAWGGWGEGIGWLGYPYLAELTQRPEYRVISEVRAEEMTRKWIELTYADTDDDADPSEGMDKLDKLNEAMRRFNVQKVFHEAAIHDGFFGRGAIYIDTGASEKPNELRAPLLIDARKIGKGDLKGLRTIEPMWMYPGLYNSTNPLLPAFFKPQTWFVQSSIVHHTRLIVMVGREVPDILKPAYAFGGLSLSQMAKPYVDNWLRARQSVSDTMNAFSIVVLATNLSAMLMQGGGALLARVNFFNLTRNNKGTFMVDKDTEDLKNLAVPLGTLDKLQAQAQEHMASVSRIPLVKLLGITPSGLNASSDGEIRVFYDTINAQQQQMFGGPLKRVLDLIQLNEFGEIDPNVGFKFLPLWQLDEAAQAAVDKTKADTQAVYMQEGVISPEEVRGVLTADHDSPYAGLDPNDVPELPDMMDPTVSITGNPAASAEPKSAEMSGV